MVQARQKGQRNERELRTIFKEAGFREEKQNNAQFSSNDYFNEFDFMAMAPESPVIMCQSKTGAASGITTAHERTDFVPRQHVLVLYAVRYDRQGWRIIKVTEDGYEDILDERELDIDNIGDGVREWLCELRDIDELPNPDIELSEDNKSED